MFNWWAWIVPATKSRENEKFWEFLKGHDIYPCELKDRGEYGVEAQSFKNAELLASYRHETRALAVQCASLKKEDIEKGGE
jgi:hypothetical protein